MAAIRRAEVVWEGDLVSGRGQVTAASSGAFTDLPATWASRSEDRAAGKTSPEELIAAAHATCFSMALSAQLAKARTPPQRLEVSASVTFDEKNLRVVSSVLEVRGSVAGIDAARFAALANAAKDGCPVSQALKGNVQLEVRAQLLAEATAEQQA